MLPSAKIIDVKTKASRQMAMYYQKAESYKKTKKA